MRFQVGRFGNLWYVIDTKISKFVYGPYKQRMTAMGKLGKLNRKVKNPIGSTYRQIQASKVHTGDTVRDIRTKIAGYVKRVHENNLWVRWEDGEYSVTTRRNVIKVMSKGPGKGKLPNPKGTVIYGRLLRIEAQKTQPHACDADCASRDHKYYHDFKKSSHAQVIGLPDKSLHIVSRGAASNPKTVYNIFDDNNGQTVSTHKTLQYARVALHEYLKKFRLLHKEKRFPYMIIKEKE